MSMPTGIVNPTSSTLVMREAAWATALPVMLEHRVDRLVNVPIIDPVRCD